MSTKARKRAIKLMPRELRDRADAASDAPYIELLETDLRSTGAAQDLMETRLVPRIYERYWRPALGRAAKGPLGPSMAGEAKIAAELLDLSEGDAVLDVACGPGNFTRRFAEIVGRKGIAVGLDGSETMLARGAAENESTEVGNVALVRGDATRLPFEDQKFDAVCCFAALHLFADPYSALAEMTRVLKPGGRIAIMTSVRRRLVPKPAKPLIERLSSMRMFEPDAITEALRQRGYGEIERRLAGTVQFVGGRLAR